MIQIWAALIIMLVLKAMAKFNRHLSNLLAFIRLNLFVKINMQVWPYNPFEECNDPPQNLNYLGFFS
ncbi:MAG: hypothetical protein DA405_05455 [Bacteroidetes bacterium]|nr:MAG: hypothetical protein DA405_05455 [Bacteroidota bacterium]